MQLIYLRQLRGSLVRLLGLFHRRRREREFAEELESHLALHIEDNLRAGMSPEEARRLALIKLGGVTLTQELHREERGLPMLETLWQDLRYGARMLLKQPGFTLIAVLTLALGIGANTAIFSLINALFLRPLPVESPNELVAIFQSQGTGWANGFSYPDFLYLRDHNTVFSGLAAYHVIDLADTGAREIVGCVVSHNYFSLLGVQPVLGRSFLEEEDEVPGEFSVAVLSHAYWQRQLAGDPSIIGKTIRLNGVTFTVVGIAPDGFRGAQSEFTPVDVWLPTMMAGLVTHRADTFGRNTFRLYKLIGRLKPDRTSASAEAELRILASQLEAAYPATNKGRGVRLAPVSHIHPGDFNEKARLPRLLVAGVSCLLLIACVNLAGLLLARGLNRRREIAVRLSVGASRGRIIRQLLTESLLLSLLGGAVSLPVTAWATSVLNNFYAAEIRGTSAYLNLSPDARVLGYAVLLTLLAAIAFGLAPALQASRTNFQAALKADGSAQGARRSRLRIALLVAQVAVSLILLINAGLLLQSLRNVLLNADFEAEHVAFIRVKPNLVGYGAEKAQWYYGEVARRLAGLPGVRSVSFTGAPGPIRDGLAIQLPGQSLTWRVPANHITPRYFETLSIPLIQGRDFDERDGPDKRRVVIVNEALAQRLWLGRAPIGRPILIDGKEHDVVGVARYSNYSNRPVSGDTPRDFLFLPAEQPGNRLLVRVTGDVQTMLPVLRKELNGIDPEVPISEELPLTEVVNRTFGPVRLASSVFSAAGLLALLLTALGLYGALALTVSQRTREIGIRMALGAQQHEIGKLILAEGLALVTVGIALGVPGAAMATRLLATFLYGVTATDPVTFIGVPLLLVAVTLVACYLPARRATKVDPMIALRCD